MHLLKVLLDDEEGLAAFLEQLVAEHAVEPIEGHENEPQASNPGEAAA